MVFVGLCSRHNYLYFLSISIVLYFLYRALLYRVEIESMPQEISDTICDLCNSLTNITSEVGKHPSLSPGYHAKRLYNHLNKKEQLPPSYRSFTSDGELDRARQCGSWDDSDPSELFLRCYHGALCSLENDALGNMVSPSLMGSVGLIPLSIIGPLHDVCRHMSNLIARAEKEVFLATNFWVGSESSRLIASALTELSRRAESRGRRVIAKIMYDRGDPKQIVDNHLLVHEKQYTGSPVELPSSQEIPFVDLEVQNYHRPVLGTFHSKFMVVDRRIAIVQSNNIQDNDNIEMMTQLEGPIVDSIYDTALLAWERLPNPRFACLDDPASEASFPSFNGVSFLNLIDKSSEIGRSERHHYDRLPLHSSTDPHYDPTIEAEIRRMQSVLTPQHNESHMNAVTRHLNRSSKLNLETTAPECPPEDQMTPLIAHNVRKPFPIALVNRKPHGSLGNQSLHTPQNSAWLSAIANAKSSIFIQTPDLNASPIISAIADAVCRGVQVTYYVCLGYNDAGELLPLQGGTNEMVASRLYGSLNAEQKRRLCVHYYVAKDQVRPVYNGFKARSCHIKLMIVDECLGIQGSGNLDTQSFFHSMEVNIMIGSREICGQWMDGLRRNQNTHLYGAASQDDGVWRDENGNEAEGAMGKDPGRFSWAKGVVGAVQRVRGLGGF